MTTLKSYQEKRNFSKTTEPSGEIDEAFCNAFVRRNKGKTLGKRPIYIIQRHAASLLHYVLRIEFDGELLSWALPKEPPTQHGVKRLAVQTEDHPIEYSLFEGSIPAGNYGAGTVKIWDRGHFETLDEKAAKLVVVIRGTKLNGKYVLLKTGFQGKNTWLFFKGKE